MTVICDGLGESKCLTQVLSIWETKTAIEPSANLSTLEFLQNISFPQREQVSRFSTHHF